MALFDALKDREDTQSDRGILSVSLGRLHTAMSGFIAYLNAPPAGEDVGRWGRAEAAIRVQDAKLRASINELSQLDIATNYNINKFNTCIRNINTLLNDIGTIDYDTAQNEYDSSVRPSFEEVQRNIGVLQQQAIIGRTKWITLKNTGIAAGVVGIGALAMATGLPKKVGPSLTSAGKAVAGAFDVRGVEDDGTPGSYPSGTTDQKLDTNPTLTKIFNNFKVKGGVENVDKQKFDNLFDAIQGSSQNAIMENIKLGYGQGIKPFKRKMKYPVDGVPGVECTAEVIITADQNGGEMNIVFSLLARVDSTKKKTYENTYHFKRDAAGGDVFVSESGGSFRKTGILEMEKVLESIQKFLGE